MHSKKESKYQRLIDQLIVLLNKDSNLIAQLSTVNALLYHKMQNFFWVGFYFKAANRLIVGPYQGPIACQILEFPNGVCWESIKQNSPIIVNDVHKFPGHVACDARSKSEIVIPLRNSNNEIIAVLDIDSDKTNQFDLDDINGLKRILELINRRYIDEWQMY